MATKIVRISGAKAMRAVTRKLPILTTKKLNENLEYAADDLADAYRIGAEEAQHEIAIRIRQLILEVQGR